MGGIHPESLDADDLVSGQLSEWLFSGGRQAMQTEIWHEFVSPCQNRMHFARDE
jgi:hypothetical protein